MKLEQKIAAEMPARFASFRDDFDEQPTRVDGESCFLLVDHALEGLLAQAARAAIIGWLDLRFLLKIAMHIEPVKVRVKLCASPDSLSHIRLFSPIAPPILVERQGIYSEEASNGEERAVDG